MEAGNFTIVGRLGESPLGTLYEAVQRQTGDRVVIRVLTAALSREPNLLGRLQALMRALTRLEPERSVVMLRPIGRDPAQPTLLDCGRTESGLLYIASEYVGGESLSVQLQRHAGLPLPNKALRIGRQLSACLAVAHGLGIRHQGLRPDKILLAAAPGTADGEQVKLLDLGLLDALGRGPRLAELSPAQVAYLAPEQRRGEAVQGGQADVFALGVILYEMGSGGLPAVSLADVAAEPASFLSSGATQTGLLQLLPSWLQPFAAILDRMLAANPAERPTMGQVASTLQQLSSLAPGSSSVSAPPSSATPKLPMLAVPGPLPGARPRSSVPSRPMAASAVSAPSRRSGGSLPPSGASLPPPQQVLGPLPSSMATPKYGMPIGAAIEPPRGLAGPAAAVGELPPTALSESGSPPPSRLALREQSDLTRPPLPAEPPFPVVPPEPPRPAPPPEPTLPAESPPELGAAAASATPPRPAATAASTTPRALAAAPPPVASSSPAAALPPEPLKPSLGLLPTEPPTPSLGVLPTEPLKPSLGLLPTEPQGPSLGLLPTEPLKPSLGLLPTEPPKPSHGVLPTEAPKPSLGVQPTEPLKPSLGLLPTEPLQPSPGVLPTESQKPSLGLLPTEPQRPSLGLLPIEPQRPSLGLLPTEPQRPSLGLLPTEPPAEPRDPASALSPAAALASQVTAPPTRAPIAPPASTATPPLAMSLASPTPAPLALNVAIAPGASDAAPASAASGPRPAAPTIDPPSPGKSEPARPEAAAAPIAAVRPGAESGRGSAAPHGPGARPPTPTSDLLSDMPTIAPTVGFRAAASGSKPPPAPASAAADESAPEQVIEMEAEQTSSLPIGSSLGGRSTPRRAPELSADEPPEYTLSDMPTGVHPGALPKAQGLALESTELSGDGLSPVPSQLAATGGTPIEPGVGGVVALHPGQLVGNFRISAKIGQGGMGAVYAAVHRQIGRRAAVKVLHGPLAKTADYAGRFLNEARAVNTIRHPGLVEIFDFGQLPDGTLYIIMEFLEGESLRAHERRSGPLAEAKAKALALQIAQALLAAHKNGIVHRDLKPENVMLIVDPAGEGAERVKVLDFGIAKVAPPGSTPKPEPDGDGNEFATAVGTTMGTPKYMAPEQYGSAAKVDGKADVFALGVMLYEMVSGQVPFPKTSLSAFAEPPRPLGEVQPSVSPGLAALVSRMLSAKADRRPTMAEVIAELTPPPTATGAQTTVTAPPAPPPSRSVWPWVVVLTLGVLGFAGAGLWALREHLVPPPAPSEITLEQNDLQLDVMGPRARALGALYVGLRSADPELRAQAVQALGQSRDSAQWTSIASLLKDPELRVQAAAAEALGVLGAPEAQEPLLQLLAANPPPGLRVAVAGALSRLQSPRGPIVLRELLASGDDRVKLRAGLLLVETGDLSARPGLWAALQKQALPDDVLLGVLSKLAHSGDALATQQLNARMGDEGFTLRRISAAANLARIGDERALAVLGQAARTPGPQQLLASLMLAKVGDASGFPRLLRVATDDKEPLAARQVAIEGVAACGRRQGALLLTRILDEKQASQVLRQSAAGAILQIAGGDPDQIAKQSLGWAQAALGHDSWLVRESATAVLGDIDSDQAVPLLSRALADPQQAVRRSAAVALGRKRLRGAMLALRTSLNDAEPEVRLAGMRAIGRIVDAIGRSGAVDDELNARLRELTETGSPNDQLVACGTLLQLGDESQHERLRQALSEPDATTRQLVVETVPAGDPLLVDALGDQAQIVRFAAARRLATQKVRAAAPVLREALGQGGPESVIAYGLLKKMGEAVSPPAGFGELLGRGDLPTSLALLDVAADLPPAEALPLLQKARFDSSPTLRRRVVEVAFALHKSAPSDASLSLIYSLLADPDVSVRARAGALAGALARHEPSPVAAPLDLGAPADQAAPLDQEVADGDSEVGSARGLLKLEGEEKVRFQIDRRPLQVLSPATAEISLSPGPHRVKFAGGVREVEITPGGTVVVQISATYADQLLGEAGEAAGRHEYARAQHLLDLVKSLAQRGRVSRAAHIELAYQQARVYEGLGRFLEAMTEYQRLLAMPEGQRKPEQTAAANAAVARLSQHLGRIEITKEDHGHCLRTVLWVHAGEHQIGQESGLASGARTPGGAVAPRVVRVREGGKVVVELCKGAPP